MRQGIKFNETMILQRIAYKSWGHIVSLIGRLAKRGRKSKGNSYD
jgi:hypothetical protein